ncbi:MAG: DNA translocase FtsK [Patescibacteria group bacterium]
MARRRRSYKKEEESAAPIPTLSPETRRGILVVVFFAAAAVLFLSNVGLAGGAGVSIDRAAAFLFGWDRFIVPFILVLIGASLLFERVRLSTWNYVGLLFFFLSFNAVINLIAFHSALPASATEIASAGGYIGLLLFQVLFALIGFWGALVVTLALLLVSLMLLFNTSLSSLFTVHTHLSGRLGEMFHRKSAALSNETWEEPQAEAEEVEETEETGEEEGGEEAPAFRKSSIGSKSKDSEPEEQVLSSKTHRKIEIPLDLLEIRNSRANSGDITRNREIIQKTLSQFGIDVEMADTAVGPTVTQYALRPAEGVKLARIIGLQNDLAMALAAHPIRIEAPIPGKSLVGIEVPNQSAAIVCLRDLMESKAFKTRESQTSVALGKDVSGNAWVARLEKMPHLLVAGATGSGKSVCLHSIILSLLYQNGPDDLKLIMIDPKRVELTVYTGIPHLLIPPITKVEDTINALKWTVREMERRLDILSKFGARDLAGYNAKAEAKIPKLVVIVDELADLMSTSRNEVEGSIVRIAQMARAVGIHLVLATQRPSVDVITGIIKANVPARIAFAVASQIDSRTILDCAGAEKLLGRGDMLYSAAELGKPKRLQGPFVSDGEIEKVVKFLRQVGAPDYNYAITEKQKTGTVLDMMGDDDNDPVLEEAIQVTIEAGKCSTSLLQRRLKLGYARAARIVDLLEQNGIVGPGDGAKPREVLITEWPPAGSSSDDSGDPAELEAAADEILAEAENMVEQEAGTESEEEDWFIDDKKA